MSATLIGASLGFGMQLYINALRKLPLLRNPWEHVFWTGVGAAAANMNAEWEAKLRKEVAELNKERQATNASFMESILKEK
ncbi:hypothetical protein MICPUN_109457 [Micromonas commoda]|uniref:Uncharacterized protein n=1 Tax=Micromonas commoda (strain RCC299 / NOUM17 / CCMP2709) TaxID=296587 RepID=C1EGU2_MICCC|nr:hypothetical protein MICPUN_109457 [Micromonas commoda]ACO67185.1 hypothetical protein MICPUN_109457 [Micromonas commoda]|mmetsp:Transcript_13/g.52  ORF Transcript_13/g.52 Transcript_13/m.52 type:complete len:81 (+) Transcript_13:93-335(+)|eukprot:XP_002505927.1 hypothetical protein MICPUN_109457 [Micromonas commoda]